MGAGSLDHAGSLCPAWTFFYSMIWGFALVFSGALIATFASRRLTATSSQP
jgi:hypothetical protein